MAVINMQLMRYINLLDKIARVKTTRCFLYNNQVFFAVNKNAINKANGRNSENLKHISKQIGKRVKVIVEPAGIEDAQRFISEIVAPVHFRSCEIKDGILALDAGSQSKAALIGKGRRREEELRQIIKDNFGLELEIV